MITKFDKEGNIIVRFWTDECSGAEIKECVKFLTKNLFKLKYQLSQLDCYTCNE
jgi:hypothetical protein